MNAYQALGVAEDASSDDIRHAYHRLARCHHPDSAGTSADAEAFDSIQRAWEQLRDSNAIQRVADRRYFWTNNQ